MPMHMKRNEQASSPEVTPVLGKGHTSVGYHARVQFLQPRGIQRPSRYADTKPFVVILSARDWVMDSLWHIAEDGAYN